MHDPVESARGLLVHAHGTLKQNVQDLTLEEALFAGGGYRSILGVLKHTCGWAHVYRSYAFDAKPHHFETVPWPRGLPRYMVNTDKDYLEEVIASIDHAMQGWDAGLEGISAEELEEDRKVHWGATAPLDDIVVMVASHLAYHAGELNMLLSIKRGEAWEYTEEVEENHIDTFDHGVRGLWMTDEDAEGYRKRWASMRESARGARSDG